MGRPLFAGWGETIMINKIEGNKLMNFKELINKTMGLIDQAKNKTTKDLYRPTYFEDLDLKIKGLESGKITAIVGRPSMGKTLFALNLVRNIVSKGTPVLVFSLSLCKEEWTKCLLCSSANLDLHKTRIGKLNEEETARLNEAAGKLSSLPLLVLDGQHRLEDIIKTISESIKEHKSEMVLIDGMSDIYGNTLQTSKSRGKRYDKQLRILKEQAEEWNIPVLITQGLSRRTERDPYLAIPKHEFSIKEGNLSEHAGRILHLYREEYYNPKKNNRGQMNIRIPAMKYGEVSCTVNVNFERSTGLVAGYGSKELFNLEAAKTVKNKI